MLVQADLRQFPAHSERHEKHAEHVVIEVAHAGCLRRRNAARPCEAAVPCISVICTTAARLRPCQKVRPHFWAARIYMKSVPKVLSIDAGHDRIAAQPGVVRLERKPLALVVSLVLWQLQIPVRLGAERRLPRPLLPLRSLPRFLNELLRWAGGEEEAGAPT